MDLALYPHQYAALEAPSAEVLLTGDNAGKSYTLRAGAILNCLEYPGLQVALLHPRHDEMVRDHVEGRSGIKALLAENLDLCTFTADAAIFNNGSRLLFYAADKPGDTRRLIAAKAHLVLVDDAHRISKDLYLSVRAMAQRAGGRVMVAAPLITKAGWVAEHFTSLNGGGFVIPMAASDLPDSITSAASVPTIEQFMDGLGFPFLASDSSFRNAAYVKVIVGAVQKWFFGTHKRLLITIPTQHGKLLRIDTPMLTARGWTTMGTLREGDQVYAPDGQPTTITYKSPREVEQEYRVTSEDGFTVGCHAEHEWVVRRPGCREWTTELTRDLHAFHGPVRLYPLSETARALVPSRHRARLKQPRHISVTKIDRRAVMQCISVDHPSHQYLCGEGLLPTHNTLLGVRVAAAYVAACRPYETIGVASYSATEAKDRNRDIRDFYIRAGGLILAGASTTDYWKTPYGGGCWAVGFAGGAGKPMSWGLIDDPDKDPQTSKSQAEIKKKDDWYQGVWLKREGKHSSKGLSLLCASTRTWSSDTVARMLRFHAERGEEWHIVALPALYDPTVANHYESFAPGLFTVEPDFRKEENEPIDVERYQRDYWELNKKSNPRVFYATDQQKPEDAGGGVIFDEGWPIDRPDDPAFVLPGGEKAAYFRPCRAHDFAATEGGGAYTANVKIGEERLTERMVIRHAARARFGPRGVLRFIAAMALMDGSDVDVVIPEDPAAGGEQQTDRVIQYLKDVTKRLSVDCKPCAGQKCAFCKGSGKMRFERPRIRTVSVRGMEEYFEDFAAKAHPISSHVEGNMDYVKAEWRPVLTRSIPWFWRAAEGLDADWQEEFREIEKVSREVIDTNARWWVEYFRELHLYPDAKPNDWTAATAYAAQYLRAPRSVYPGSK